MDQKDKLVFSLDYSDGETAMEMVTRLRDQVNIFKVGLELFTNEGRSIVRRIKERNKKVCLDLKLHDIPVTMAKTVASAFSGVDMFTIHASAGYSGMRAVVERKGNAMVFAVTVLTCLGDDTPHKEDSTEHIYGSKTQEKVYKFAGDAWRAGCDGIVCSPRELEYLNRYNPSAKLKKMTPAIRDAQDDPGDQHRTMTAEEAAYFGADYIVIGRPIASKVLCAAAAANCHLQIARGLERRWSETEQGK